MSVKSQNIHHWNWWRGWGGWGGRGWRRNSPRWVLPCVPSVWACLIRGRGRDRLRWGSVWSWPIPSPASATTPTSQEVDYDYYLGTNINYQGVDNHHYVDNYHHYNNNYHLDHHYSKAWNIFSWFSSWCFRAVSRGWCASGQSGAGGAVQGRPVTRPWLGGEEAAPVRPEAVCPATNRVRHSAWVARERRGERSCQLATNLLLWSTENPRSIGRSLRPTSNHQVPEDFFYQFPQ